MSPDRFRFILFVLFVSVVIRGGSCFNALDDAFLLRDRSPSSYGGFALAADPCPGQLSGRCPPRSGKCCPPNTVCKLVATAKGYVCCPSSDNCVPAVNAAPDCALDTWVLWKNAVSYFCCLPGQIGVKAGNKVGNCVASNVPVELTASATMVTPASSHPGIGSATSLGGSPAPSESSTSSATAASTTAASSTQAAGTTTASASPSRTGGVTTSDGNIMMPESIISRILGVLGFFLALVLVV